MAKIIIYQDDDGLKVVYPTGALSIDETARKDVPEGVRYRIIEDSLLPSDDMYRNAWVADMSNHDGVGGGHDAWAKEWIAARDEELKRHHEALHG